MSTHDNCQTCGTPWSDAGPDLEARLAALIEQAYRNESEALALLADFRSMQKTVKSSRETIDRAKHAVDTLYAERDAAIEVAVYSAFHVHYEDNRPVTKQIFYVADQRFPTLDQARDYVRRQIQCRVGAKHD